MNLRLVEPEEYRFSDDGRIPNHPSYPLLLYFRTSAAGFDDAGDWIEERFLANGWQGTWRWGVYNFPHYHSNAHEVLGVARGHARIQLGGEQGQAFDLTIGDVLILPAGTGHQCLEASADFQVVGAYPPGEEADLIRAGEGNIAQARERIREVPKPQSDPLYGATGPLLARWVD